MVKKYLLDTNVCINLLKGKQDMVKKIATVGMGHCCISDITLAELYFGAHKSGRQKHFDEVDYIKTLFDVLPSSDCYDEYGKTRWQLEQTGNRIDNFDLLIAATAIHNKLTVVTANTKHFSHIENLKFENWEAGNQ